MLVWLSLPVALWAAGVCPVPAVLAFGASIAVLAALLGGLALQDLRRSRSLGDALLRSHPGLQPISGLAAWRSAELTSVRERRTFSRLAYELATETEACRGPDVPEEEAAVFARATILLRRLECRLELLSQPVSPLGMLELHALAKDVLSPIDFPERVGWLPAALSRALAALEPA